MPDPSWPSSPPEVNYLRLLGPGAAGTATTLASGAAWQALMAGNEALFAASTASTAATALDFEGVGGASSTAAVSRLNALLQLLSCWAQEKPPIAASAVAAYEMAVSSMIPAEVALANRAEQAADVALNPMVLGALTPAIVALDTVYFGEFWPQNASSGAVYGATLAALAAALAVPPPMSPPGAAAAAPATGAAAVAQAAGQVAAAEAMEKSADAATATGSSGTAPAHAVAEGGRLASALSQPLQTAIGALQPAMGMFQAPAQAAQALASLPQSMSAGLAGAFGRDGLGSGELPTALLGNAGGAGVGSVTAGAGPAVGGGGGGFSSAAGPAAGLTSYTRPPTSFPSENGGRPAGLKTGLLSAMDTRGVGPTGLGGSAIPAGSPTASGQTKGAADKDGVAHARITYAVAPKSKGGHS